MSLTTLFWAPCRWVRVSETMVRRVNNSEVDLKKVKVNRNLGLGLVWAIEKGAWVVFLFD